MTDKIADVECEDISISVHLDSNLLTVLIHRASELFKQLEEHGIISQSPEKDKDASKWITVHAEVTIFS